MPGHTLGQRMHKTALPMVTSRWETRRAQGKPSNGRLPLLRPIPHSTQQQSVHSSPKRRPSSSNSNECAWRSTTLGMPLIPSDGLSEVRSQLARTGLLVNDPERNCVGVLGQRDETHRSTTRSSQGRRSGSNFLDSECYWASVLPWCIPDVRTP